jgi:hypothetical protein
METKWRKPPLAIKDPGPSIIMSRIAIFSRKNCPTPIERFSKIFTPEGPSIAGGPFNTKGPSITGGGLSLVTH